MGHHYELEVFKEYIDNQLALDQQQMVEEHLNDCDVCFTKYLAAIDDWSIPYTVSDSFTDDTIELLKTVQPNLSQQEKSYSPPEQRRKTAFNYFLAAGLTIILMFSGVFQYMFQISEQLQIEDQPLSEQLMEKATGFLDQTDEREEDNNE